MQRCYRDFSTPISPVRAEPCPSSLLEPVRPRSVPRRNPSCSGMLRFNRWLIGRLTGIDGLIGRRGWTRTSDPQLRRLMLYPPELRARDKRGFQSRV